MPDISMWVEITLDYVADHTTAITAGTIVFGGVCLLLFRRHKFLRPYFILIVFAGPALAVFAAKHGGGVDIAKISRADIDRIVGNVRYDFDGFKRQLDLAVQAGKIRRSGADTYISQARRYHKQFMDKMNSVARTQRKYFRDLQMKFKTEIKNAEETLGELKFE